ncbi:MAG: YqgE/AlgH family protein [Beijerinckiaceae bacterium]|nr:YqgE/AlgH family protein [Beijerinckiaceae bacterium]
MALRTIDQSLGGAGYLDGHMLIAMPGMKDERFQRSVVYICAHSHEGAMGIVINQRAPDISFTDLLVQLDVIGEDQAIRLPPRTENIRVLKGGPVESGRGFVLHSSDFFIEHSTLPIDPGIGVCLTATLDILKAIASGEGPDIAMLALGYAAWSPGQLEQEISNNGWLTCAADGDIVFGAPLQDRYDLAMRKLGIDPRMLSAEIGHA